jgi:hypothetical protein
MDGNIETTATDASANTEVSTDATNATVADTQTTTTTPAETTTGKNILSEEPSGEFDVNTIIDSNGNFKEDWTKNLGDPDLAESKILQQFKDIHGLVKSLEHSQRMMGKKVISPKDMDDDTRQQFMKEWGVPDDPKEYGLKPPEELPEGVEYNEAGLEWFAQTAKEVGIPKDMAQQLVEKFDQYQFSMLKDQISAKAEADAKKLVDAEAQLKDKYGAEYGAVISKARLTAESLTEKQVDDIDFIDLNNPKAIEWLYRTSERLGEDKLVNMDSTGGASKAAKSVEYEDLMRNPARVDPTNPDYHKLNRRFMDLGAELYPGMTKI